MSVDTHRAEEQESDLRPIAHGRGVWQVLRFNFQQYLAGVAVIVVGAWWGHPLGLCAAAVALWFTVASLVASYWIYDLSDLYAWRWIGREIVPPPQRWLSVTTGFDQHSRALESLFPGEEHRIVDVFDRQVTTEASVRRAREASIDARALAVERRPGRVDALPVADAAFDAGFLIFSAHELRDAAERRALFGELARALRPGGTLLIVEQPRDFANLCAFGPGAFHFLPADAWRREPAAAGFEFVRAGRRTPFVETLVWRRS